VQQLALQSGVSVGSAWTATKLLHISSYRITIVPENKPMDYEKRGGFVIGLSIMCMTSRNFSQMRLISISWDKSTHRTTGIGEAKILIINCGDTVPTP
jgi:hypothetical protein